jgi:hypothetical protein
MFRKKLDQRFHNHEHQGTSHPSPRWPHESGCDGAKYERVDQVLRRQTPTPASTAKLHRTSLLGPIFGGVRVIRSALIKCDAGCNPRRTKAGRSRSWAISPLVSLSAHPRGLSGKLPRLRIRPRTISRLASPTAHPREISGQLPRPWSGSRRSDRRPTP